MKRSRWSFIASALLCLVMSVSSNAKVVTADEVRQNAVRHLGQTKRQFGRDIVLQRTLSETEIIRKDGEAALYIFNVSSGGFIIASADDETDRQILGYSDSGCYDPENVSPQLKAILDSYASGIAEMRRCNDSGGKVTAANLSLTSMPSSVSPLLGNIAWGQGSPYNGMCPTSIGTDGIEYHSVTGCVATAIAQVMKFHEWPAKASGTGYYFLDGEKITADINGSEYKWKMMRSNYNDGNQYTQEEADAVALLMRDIGVAVRMSYGLSVGSGAYLNGWELVKFFDYDRNLKLIQADCCTTDEWEGVLLQELAAGYPVLCSGGSSGGAHEFVCDGYNEEGLFHYNFGWDGLDNGWFACTATGFDASPSIVYGIRPDNGGKGALSLHSAEDFKWTDGNNLIGDLSYKYIGLDSDDEIPTTEIGLALKNVETGSVTIFKTNEFCINNFSFGMFKFDETVSDGSYKVYPVARIAGEEWQTFFHNSMYQLEVDLTVENGVKTWANNGITDPIDEGVVLIDGIYYTLDEEQKEATVTRRNSKGGSYSGIVAIPDEVSYKDCKYSVTYIGESAFANCTELDSVYVGANVKMIKMGAFDFSTLRAIEFAEGSKLESIGGWAFNACSKLENMTLPEGVSSIGMSAFQSTGLKNISLPSTIYVVSPYCFAGSVYLSSIHVKWTSLTDVYWSDSFREDGITPGLTLYVPKGYAQIYNCEPWTFCTIVEEGVDLPIEESYLYVLGCDGIWNPASASAKLALRSDGCYGGDITVSDVGDGFGYFCIGTVQNSDWAVFNANRLGAPDSDYQLSSGTVCGYVIGLGNSFRAQAGTHHLVVDTESKTIAFDMTDGVAPVPDVESGAMFNLNGQPVLNPSAGHVIIQKGHKYIVE